MSWALSRLQQAAVEAAVVFAIAAGFSFWVFQAVWRAPASIVLGPLSEDLPTDLDGTVWFYAWVDRAVTLGLPILSPRWVHFPQGQNLGQDFPNRIDALLALPFMHFLRFPLGFNLFETLIPAFGTLGAYGFLRSLTDRRWLALAGALIFGFQRYTFYELAGGRPVSALVMILPLFLAAWWTALGTANRRDAIALAALSGVLASLAVQSYAPWTLWLAPVGVGCALCRTVVPAVGCGRSQAPLLGILALTVAAIGIAPYAHELYVLRGPNGEGGNPLPAWDPRVWTETWEVLRAHPPGANAGLDSLPVQANSVALDGLWNAAAAGADRASLPGGTWVVLLVAATLGGREARCWGLAGLVCWASLGGADPTAMLGRSPAWLQAAGPWIPSPLALFVGVAPAATEHLRAYRGAPVASLLLIASIVTAWRPFASICARQAVPGRIAKGLAALVIASLAARVISNAVTVDAHRVPLTLWNPPAFYEALAADPDSGAVIDMPVGMGHAFGPSQLVHRHDRSESATGVIGEADRRLDPALDAIRRLGGSGDPPDGPGTVAGLHQQGFGWIIVHVAAYSRRTNGPYALSLPEALAWLDANVGSAVYKDPAIVVYRL